jgi:hypothetical protein
MQWNKKAQFTNSAQEREIEGYGKIEKVLCHVQTTNSRNKIPTLVSESKRERENITRKKVFHYHELHHC